MKKQKKRIKLILEVPAQLNLGKETIVASFDLKKYEVKELKIN